jgi:hypothetical protein
MLLFLLYVHAHTGLPFRASCCWNGLAVLKAAPFKAGVRIRPPMKDECQVSQCVVRELKVSVVLIYAFLTGADP